MEHPAAATVTASTAAGEAAQPRAGAPLQAARNARRALRRAAVWSVLLAVVGLAGVPLLFLYGAAERACITLLALRLAAAGSLAGSASRAPGVVSSDRQQQELRGEGQRQATQQAAAAGALQQPRPPHTGGAYPGWAHTRTAPPCEVLPPHVLPAPTLWLLLVALLLPPAALLLLQLRQPGPAAPLLLCAAVATLAQAYMQLLLAPLPATRTAAAPCARLLPALAALGAALSAARLLLLCLAAALARSWLEAGLCVSAALPWLLSTSSTCCMAWSHSPG